MKRTKEFFEPIAKLQIAFGIKGKKKTSKAISVIKEDRQAFSVILGDEIDLSEALKYPITSIPLSIRNPDDTLRQSPKNIFRNFLIDQSSAIQIEPHFQTRWIIEIIRSVKSKKTYKKCFTALIKIVVPYKHWNPESIEFICDTCRSISSKSCVFFKSKHKNMMSRKDWAVFFHNIENKQVLCNLFANFIRKSHLRDISDVPVVIANNVET